MDNGLVAIRIGFSDDSAAKPFTSLQMLKLCQGPFKGRSTMAETIGFAYPALRFEPGTVGWEA